MVLTNVRFAARGEAKAAISQVNNYKLHFFSPTLHLSFETILKIDILPQILVCAPHM